MKLYQLQRIRLFVDGGLSKERIAKHFARELPGEEFEKAFAQVMAERAPKLGAAEVQAAPPVVRRKRRDGEPGRDL